MIEEAIQPRECGTAARGGGCARALRCPSYFISAGKNFLQYLRQRTGKAAAALVKASLPTCV